MPSSIPSSTLFHRFLIAALLILLTTPSLVAMIIVVPRDMMTIQGAIDAVNPNDTVLINPGRYQENLNFNGKSLSLVSQFVLTGDPDDIAETTLDGGYNGRSAIRLANGEGGLICGFTIVNDSTDYGGGIYIRSGRITVRNMIIKDCFVVRNGGAIYVTGVANATISDVVMQNNHCGYVGGAMSVYTGATATITGSVITGNYSEHVGGAIHTYGSRVTILNCTIADNGALHNAGSIYLTQAANVEVVNTILWHNEPNEAWGLAGFAGERFAPSFCDIEGYRDKIFIFDSSYVDWGPGNFDAAPQFRNPAIGDYSLRDNSPCIDAGDYESPPDQDGTRADIGAIAVDQEDGGQHVFLHSGDFNSIQDKINAAGDGDVVLVLPGTYEGSIDFSGKAITVASRTISTGIASYADSTILDANGQGSAVMFANGEGASSVLDGFTLSNGSGTWYEADDHFGNLGGGVFCIGSAPIIRNCLITGNDVGPQGQHPHGGGVFCGEGSEPLLQNVRIIDNQAMYGAGMAIRSNSHVSMENVTISDNRATAGDDSWGGGIWCFERSSFEMRGGEISGNISARGAAIAMSGDEGSAVVRKVAIVNNRGLNGSAYFGSGFPSIFDNITFSGNGIEMQGATIFYPDNRDGSLRITNSIVFDNQASFIRHDASDSLTITYSLIEGGEDSVRVNQDMILDYGEGNFDADPQFTNIEAGDYSLTENSPCIDAGDPDSPSDPDGTANDLGAYYFHQAIQHVPSVIRVPADFATIQSAIDAAMEDDTILVEPGRYRENIDFLGKRITLASNFLLSNDPEDIIQTIIEGLGNAETVRFGRIEVRDCHLTGFTITGGYGREGGAIFCLRANPTIANCVITGNRAEDGGGGIYIYGSFPLMVNLTIAGNSADAGGPQVHLRNGSYPEFVNCIIFDEGDHPIVISGDRDPCQLEFVYCQVSGGENGIALNFNDVVHWNEGNIASNPLFIAPDEGDYRLSPDSPCINTGNPDQEPDPDGSRVDIGALRYIPELVIEDFAIPLRSGWGIIGSPVSMEIRSMDSVWRNQLDADNLLMVKDMNGRFFAPRYPFNNIPEWVVWQGYQVKMERTDTLFVRGIVLRANERILLRQGWSMISYQPDVPTEAMIALANYTEYITLIKDEMGRFFSPERNFDNIGLLRRGKGYKILTTSTVDLVWNLEPAHRHPSAEERLVMKPSLQPQITDRNMSVLICLGEKVRQTLEIQAFTEEGLLVGATVAMPNDYQVGMAVWGDDLSTDVIDGAREGENIVFRLSGGDDRGIEASYRTDDFIELRIDALAQIPTEFGLGTPYPNPFNSTVSIEYQTPTAGEISLRIFDSSGREMTTVVGGVVEAGYHRAIWKADRISSGVYFCRMEADGYRGSVKVLLIK